MNDSALIYKRLKDVLIGEMIGKDILANNGACLVTKGTYVTETVINRLWLNEIPAIYIEDPQYIVKSVTERKDFKKFKALYEEKLDELRQTLRKIGDNGAVDLQQLYNLTNDIMMTMNCQSDVFTYLSFLKNFDDYTFSHSSNVALLAYVFAGWMNFSESDKRNITIAGILHDIGKTAIPKQILNKKDKLTDEEYQWMQMHTQIGYDMIKDKDLDNSIKLAVLMHHERINGTGYPGGLMGQDIAPFAKIIAICDIYDAMTANRIYRNKISPFTVIHEFESHSYGELDTYYLVEFLKNIANNYINSWVELSDGRIGEVIFIHPNQASRPIVRVGAEMINLAEKHGLEIMAVI